jgi:hypothetical protein
VSVFVCPSTRSLTFHLQTIVSSMGSTRTTSPVSAILLSRLSQLSKHQQFPDGKLFCRHMQRILLEGRQARKGRSERPPPLRMTVDFRIGQIVYLTLCSKSLCNATELHSIQELWRASHLNGGKYKQQQVVNLKTMSRQA